MKVILFGGTGMVGQGVLRECLRDAGVSEVLSIGRRPLGQNHAKLRELIVPDPGQLNVPPSTLGGYDACFFCLGVSSFGLSEAEFTRLIFDLTLGAARKLAPVNPQMAFIYVSGAGCDTSEQGRVMWARVKGRTENALRALPFRAVYLFRPGAIEPRHGIRSNTALYRWAYVLLAPLLPLLRRWAPQHLTSTDRVGLAMLQAARHGAPSPWVEMRDIQALSDAALAAMPPHTRAP
ncbi:MAG: hypothetical protein RJA98_546 [Pseudomonadota bacterium]|jgi:uncharacterized protein YbjT (DUF2867 family)